MLARLTKKCPCCAQPMPHTDFMIYPRSTAVIRNGLVVLMGTVQFRIVEILWNAYPEPVNSQRLFHQLYNGAKNYSVQRKNLAASVTYLRPKLKQLDVTIVNVWNAYSLRLD